MTLTLILMRHAKSSWTDPTQDDFDRGLNDRGRRSAPRIAKWLAQEGHLPDAVLVSSARRTVETWERMAPHLPETATMESSPALYLATADIILGVLKAQSARAVMVICHNPGIAEFASMIVQSPPNHPDFRRYPTAATTVIEFEAVTWSKVDWQTGKVQDFAVPKDLPE